MKKFEDYWREYQFDYSVSGTPSNWNDLEYLKRQVTVLIDYVEELKKEINSLKESK